MKEGDLRTQFEVLGLDCGNDFEANLGRLTHNFSVCNVGEAVRETRVGSQRRRGCRMDWRRQRVFQHESFMSICPFFPFALPSPVLPFFPRFLFFSFCVWWWLIANILGMLSMQFLSKYSLGITGFSQRNKKNGSSSSSIPLNDSLDSSVSRFLSWIRCYLVFLHSMSECV